MMLPDQNTEHCPVCEQAMPEGSGLPVNLQVSLTSGKMLTSSYAAEVFFHEKERFFSIHDTGGKGVMYIPLASIQWLSWSLPAEENSAHG